MAKILKEDLYRIFDDIKRQNSYPVRIVSSPDYAEDLLTLQVYIPIEYDESETGIIVESYSRKTVKFLDFVTISDAALIGLV